MAGKLPEGARVWNAAKNGSINFEDMNELQDQLKAMLGPRDLLLFPSGYNRALDDLPAANPGWQLDGTFDYLENVSVNNLTWIVPISVYAGQVITEVEVQVTGTSASTGGALYLYEMSRGGAIVTSRQIDGGGNVYRCAGGTAYGNVITYTKTTADTGLPMTCLADHYYFLWLQAGSDAATQDCRIWWYHVKTQFGN